MSVRGPAFAGPSLDIGMSSYVFAPASIKIDVVGVLKGLIHAAAVRFEPGAELKADHGDLLLPPVGRFKDRSIFPCRAHASKFSSL